MRLERTTASVVASVLAACAAGCGERPPEEPAAGPPAALVPPARVEAISAGDWPQPNRDPAGTRFSPLEQIHTDNVTHLVEAWRYPLPRRAAREPVLAGGYELTPLAIGGVLYAAAADRVVALDGASGRELWRHRVAGEPPSRRGLAYWPGGEGVAARLFYIAGRRLVALDASTGEPVAAFGTGGAVGLAAPYDAAPTRFEDLLIVGARMPASVRAFDARTGTEVWAFDAAPASGGEAPSTASRAFSVAVDVDRALVYAAFAAARVGERKADDTSGAAAAGSTVALGARTGAVRWRYPTALHDVMPDHGVAAPPPTLLDVAIAGRTVPLLVQPTPLAYAFVLNRSSGEPVFGVEELAVAAAPGEHVRRVPARPPPLARVAYAAADLVRAEHTTEEHATFCREIVERGGAVAFPGPLGAVSWGGAAADPALAYAFVNTTSVGGIAPAAPADDGDGVARVHFWWDPSAERAGQAWPCQRPPWGELVALNLATGDLAWRVPLGITETLPARRQRTGRPSAGGPIATAGGLVFVAATDDRRFRAFASRTGEQLWAVELPANAHAVPITYLGGDGKQYVAIAASGAGDAEDSALIAFALP